MEINLQNIEEIIFYNSKVWQHIPESIQFYNEWSLSKRVPGLRDLGKRSILNFLNNMNNDTIQKLENFFGKSIIINKTNDKIIENISITVDDIEDNICQFDNFKDFCITRNSDVASITFWR